MCFWGARRQDSPNRNGFEKKPAVYLCLSDFRLEEVGSFDQSATGKLISQLGGQSKPHVTQMM
jgi:hypothetical protein